MKRDWQCSWRLRCTRDFKISLKHPIARAVVMRGCHCSYLAPKAPFFSRAPLLASNVPVGVECANRGAFAGQRGRSRDALFGSRGVLQSSTRALPSDMGSLLGSGGAREPCSAAGYRGTPLGSRGGGAPCLSAGAAGSPRSTARGALDTKRGARAGAFAQIGAP